jgi:adenylate cyclase
MGELFTWLGNPEEGIEWIRKAMKLNPHHPARFWSHLGKAQFAARQYSMAIEAFMRLSVMDEMQHAFIAASYGWLGDKTAAAAHLARLDAIGSGFEPEAFLKTMHYAKDSDLQHLREGLEKAGMQFT